WGAHDDRGRGWKPASRWDGARFGGRTARGRPRALSRGQSGGLVKITIVNGSLASNGILRMWIIAQLLARHYEVEAVGRLAEDGEILPWCRDYDGKVVGAEGMVEAMDRLERAITGDVVMASGIGMATFGTALLAKRRRGAPVILDMGEWEVHDHLK